MARSPSELDVAVERLLAAAFREAGWKVEREPAFGKVRPDLFVRRGKVAYVVEIKSASEARSDRVIPLLAQAILQAQAIARERSPAIPLAVIASPRIPDALAVKVHRFAIDHAPGVAVGVMDLDGFRAFLGSGLEVLNASRKRVREALPAKREVRGNLFSDLNQWMLKILLAPHVPEQLLSAPRGPHRNASELARRAEVSVMSASRLVRLLTAEGHLDESREPIRLVRIPELMQRWHAAYLRPVREWPMRWILRDNPERQLKDALASYLRLRSGESGRRHGDKGPSLPSVCLGLFAAADELGLGFVKGVKPHLYLERIRGDVLRRLGLMHADAGHPADIFVRIPVAPHSVFRGAVLCHGIPVSDVLQVWADVSGHPSRGQAQAAEIEHRALGSLFGQKGRRDGKG